MPITPDTTVGGAASNSYISVADADAYLTTRLNYASWSDAWADDRARAVIQATTWIDMYMYRGLKNAAGQALKWPRVNVVDPDGYPYATDAIPTFLKNATAELALFLLNQGTTDPFQPTGLESFKDVVVGPIEVKPQPGGKVSVELPEAIKRMLAHVIVDTPGAGRTWLA